MEQDNVNHPKHYAARGGHECIDYAQYFPFSLGCAYKYVWRAGEKEEQGKTLLEKQAEDAEKALWCVGQWDAYKDPLPRPSSIIFNNMEELEKIEQGFTGYKRGILHQFHLLLKEIHFEKPSNAAMDTITNEITRQLEYYIFSTKAWSLAYHLAASTCDANDRNLLAEFYHEGAMMAYESIKDNDK